MLQTARRWMASAGTFFFSGIMCVALATAQITGLQGELTRKVRNRVAPSYPELARRMNIRGTVKVMVVVTPSGELKDSKVMGGNPILVTAAMDALKKWKFEPGSEESTGTVEFKFQAPE